MTRGSGMKAAEKRESSLRLKVLKEYLGSLHRRLQTPAVDKCQLRPCQRDGGEAQGLVSQGAYPFILW